MNYSNLILLSVLSVGVCTSIYAQENTVSESANASSLEETGPNHPRSQIIKDLKNIKVKDLKINANAAQPDLVKDPLQSLNRPIYSFNDMLDRNLRPVAVQYREKPQKMCVVLIANSVKILVNHGMLSISLFKAALAVQQKL